MPKRTLQRKTVSRKRKHGFLSLMKKSKGQKVISRRRQKGRKKLAL